MRLVDDDRVVGQQVAVPLDLRQQDPVGHDLDPGPITGAVGEPDLVAHHVAKIGVELLRDPLGDRTGRDPPGLGMSNHPLCPAAEFEADLRKLGGLSTAGLTGDDDDLVGPDRVGDVSLALRHRQLRRKTDAQRRGCLCHRPPSLRLDPRLEVGRIAAHRHTLVASPALGARQVCQHTGALTLRPPARPRARQGVIRRAFVAAPGAPIVRCLVPLSR